MGLLELRRNNETLFHDRTRGLDESPPACSIAMGMQLNPTLHNFRQGHICIYQVNVTVKGGRISRFLTSHDVVYIVPDMLIGVLGSLAAFYRTTHSQLSGHVCQPAWLRPCYHAAMALACLHLHDASRSRFYCAAIGQPAFEESVPMVG